jgi:ketosteroid isomerase-like protein
MRDAGCEMRDFDRAMSNRWRKSETQRQRLMKNPMPREKSLLSFILTATLFGAFTETSSAAAAANDQAEIRAVMAAQVAAWNRGDIDGFMNGYARAATTEFVSGDKLTRGWQTVRDRYKKKYGSREKMGTLTFSELKITPLNRDAALVIGRWKLVRKSDKPQGRFTLLFRRIPPSRDWRIVHDHTS